MTSTPDLEFSPLCTFPSPLRELRLLDEDSVLYCMEGDKDVYEFKVSEVKERSQQNPGELFCRVPYFGIPLVLKGGKAGRLVVVVPTDRNENAEKIEEWVVAIDSFSQNTIPAPLKGSWHAATVFRGTVHLLDRSEERVYVIPKQMLFWENPVFPSRSSVSHCHICRVDTTVGKIEWDDSFINPEVYWRNSFAFVGTDNRLYCCSFQGGVRGGGEGEGEFLMKGRNLWGGDPLRVTAAAAVSCGEGSDTLVLGTETGLIYRPDSKNEDSEKEGERVLVLKSEKETDAKISTITFLPNGSLLFSQGTQLMLTDQLPGVPPLSSAALPKLAPAVSVMRRVVLKGGEGADVELSAKADTRLQAHQQEDVAMPEGGERAQDDTGEEGKVHGMKTMLSSCEFFQKALNGPFAESARGRISIPDTTTEALKCVVLYLHTDMVELRDSCAVEVSALGRFLGLSWLQEQAQEYARECISVSNCPSILLSAEKRNFPELRKRCIDFNCGKKPQESRRRPRVPQSEQRELARDLSGGEELYLRE
uniref:BTB domain-containing protein n=1 Tax=Chromera velia CCMP2878 TaxID=1169474 RepID=A0A0G4IBI6_9ALVE|eukprot:Cvel_2163.t1-p1 / transcript=Cvel_2163.t1 / gene=Cvel_2163 / organism=Chromera_velia_CCMP2878 / gene_product=hypothetical protein / transcript_product=hypothetical protein / location=Cvel_scaffold84:9263-11979(+) / protein_length=533 / sequence_SO=supercontig / SO=protein_coding / is_pseudo=false